MWNQTHKSGHQLSSPYTLEPNLTLCPVALHCLHQVCLSLLHLLILLLSEPQTIQSSQVKHERGTGCKLHEEKGSPLFYSVLTSPSLVQYQDTEGTYVCWITNLSLVFHSYPITNTAGSALKMYPNLLLNWLPLKRTTMLSVGEERGN